MPLEKQVPHPMGFVRVQRGWLKHCCQAIGAQTKPHALVQALLLEPKQWYTLGYAKDRDNNGLEQRNIMS